MGDLEKLPRSVVNMLTASGYQPAQESDVLLCRAIAASLSTPQILAKCEEVADNIESQLADISIRVATLADLAQMGTAALAEALEREDAVGAATLGAATSIVCELVNRNSRAAREMIEFAHNRVALLDAARECAGRSLPLRTVAVGHKKGVSYDYFVYDDRQFADLIEANKEIEKARLALIDLHQFIQTILARLEDSLNWLSIRQARKAIMSASGK